MATHLLEDCAHAHREGFAIMRYDERGNGPIVLTTPDPGVELPVEIERESVLVWNARNGVTPFGFNHPDTGTELTHGNWTRDHVDRMHVPALGDLIWVNLLPQIARINVTAQVEARWDDSEYPMRDAFDSKESAIDILTAGMFPDETCAPPTLMRVDGDLFGMIATRRKGWLT